MCIVIGTLPQQKVSGSSSQLQDCRKRNSPVSSSTARAFTTNRIPTFAAAPYLNKLIRRSAYTQPLLPPHSHSHASVPDPDCTFHVVRVQYMSHHLTLLELHAHVSAACNCQAPNMALCSVGNCGWIVLLRCHCCHHQLCHRPHLQPGLCGRTRKAFPAETPRRRQDGRYGSVLLCVPLLDTPLKLLNTPSVHSAFRKGALCNVRMWIHMEGVLPQQGTTPTTTNMGAFLGWHIVYMFQAAAPPNEPLAFLCPVLVLF